MNAEAMGLHLDEISFHVAPGAHAVVVRDGAGWHQTGGRLRVPDNIILMPLPPNCPELNPVESVWQYLRQNELNFTVWDSVEAVVDACCAARYKLISTPNTITSITSRKRANMSEHLTIGITPRTSGSSLMVSH
jgi:transposase